MGGRVVRNTTRMIYKRCKFLIFKSKQHVSAIYGHHQGLCQLRFHYIRVNIIIIIINTIRPPLWSSGQSFWLQIQRFRVRFPALPDFSE